MANRLPSIALMAILQMSLIYSQRLVGAAESAARSIHSMADKFPARCLRLFNPREGIRYSLILSIVTAAAVALWGFTHHDTFMAIMFADARLFQLS